MDFLELAKNRYSVRSYSSKKVEDEKIAKIVQAGTFAPTSVNSQPQMVYVCTSDDVRKIISECSPCTFNAPVIFIFSYDKNRERYSTERREYMGPMDTDIVQTHMMLEAADLGLGTCWVKMVDTVKLHDALKLPENIIITAIMPCGYPADDAKPSDYHSSFRSEEELVTYL